MTEQHDAADPLRIFTTSPDERLAPFFQRMCEPIPLRPRSKSEWLQRRSVVRQKTLQALGLDPAPDRLPLELHRGGALDREGYRVERIYWQTWPGVWASGWLYLPAERSGRVPAILNPHGHWQDGACHPVVQSRLIGQARLGYVALCVDSVHVSAYAMGVTPLTVMTYQNLRALDLLASLPEVDRERIGITGASGGAQQAMYLLAVDDRIRAAVLAVLVSYFRRILSPESHHCPCNHVPGIMRFTDEPELCGIASPRALMFLSVTGDWTAPFGEHELGELRALYSLWLQRDRLAHRRFDGPHDYNQAMREAMYTWFERELRGNASTPDVREPDVRPEPPELLRALDAPPPGDQGTEGILKWYQKRVVAQPPQLESRPSRRSYQERLRSDLRDLLGGEPEPVTLEAARHELPAAVAGGEGWRAVSFRSERDVRVPALWRAPESGKPTAVLAFPGGKADAVDAAICRDLRAAGYGVLAPDVRFRGELSRDWLHNCLAWGRPEAGMAAIDLRACVDWLCEQEEVDPRALLLLGDGPLGMAALIAAGLDERVTATVVDCCATTYRDGGEGLPVIPNILRIGDVPQIASLVSPRPLWLYRVPADRVGFSSRRYFDWTRRSHQSLGTEEALRLETGPLPAGSELPQWLHARIRRAKK